MDFNTLSWSALCFFYRSLGDKDYARIMRDQNLLQQIRQTPKLVNLSEFEDKIIQGYMVVEGIDHIAAEQPAEAVINKVYELQPDIVTLQEFTLLRCNFNEPVVVRSISRIFDSLSSIPGFSMSGVSKTMHIINDELFIPLHRKTAESPKLGAAEGYLRWLSNAQKHALGVTQDFHKYHQNESPEDFLSAKLGYVADGYKKALTKFIDEYFWLVYEDQLPVPPIWVPLPKSEQRDW